MTMNSRKTFSIALLVPLVLAGCMEEFDPPSLIERARPIGALVQVDGDPMRATPRPGEAATVTWLMAAPGELPPLFWAFAVCRAGLGDQTAACAPAPLAVADGQGAPSFQIVVPTEDVLGDAQRLTIFGQICENGAPVLVGNVPACPGAGDTVTVDILLQRSEQANHSPALAQRAFWFDGVDWPVDMGGDCAGLPVVAAGSKEHVITLRMLAEDRETVVQADGTLARETLQISQFTTDGDLDHSYNFVEASDESAVSDLEVMWDAPEVAPVDGRVRFTFVARDLRGGVGYATRAVCVQ
jgi:hypothetical protein